MLCHQRSLQTGPGLQLPSNPEMNFAFTALEIPLATGFLSVSITKVRTEGKAPVPQLLSLKEKEGLFSLRNMLNYVAMNFLAHRKIR